MQLMQQKSCEDDQPHIIDTILHSEGEHAEKLGLLKPSPNDDPRIYPGQVIGDEVIPIMEG